MSIFSKIFPRKSAAPEDPPSREVQTSVSAKGFANDPNLIRVYDKYGQELFITKDEWRTKVLPGNIQSRWNQPDELYGIIVNALNDGLYQDVLDAGAQLYSIDPQPVRGTCVYAIVLMKNQRVDDAEQVLRSYLAKHGESGVVLTNLAKVHAERKQMQAAEETLWHALEVDPNQENGFDWYLTMHQEHHGEAGRLNALQRIAALPGSWRAPIWLGREALVAGNLKEALGFYHESLSRVGHPIPADLLMQISGDLGNHGHLSELLALTEPHFVADNHGLQVGNNLIKAHLQLGHLERAQTLVDQLYSFKRPDWRETLAYWETEIAKARVAGSQPAKDESLHIEMLTIAAPVWLDSSSPAQKLFHLSENGPVITFLGGSAEVANASEHAELQMADAPGRMSRALPLFLAEQVSFSCAAKVRTWLPWLANAGFVMSGGAWTNENLLEFSQQASDKSEYLIVIHLNTKGRPWQAELRLLAAANGHCLATLNSSFIPSNPAPAIPDLAQRLALLLAAEAKVKQQTISPLYRLPEADRLPDYLLREEQLLAVRCARMETAPPRFLHGEREIVEGNLQLCLACPQNLITRILLVQTLLSMQKVRPEVVKEFIDKVRWLQKEYPLSQQAHAAVEEMLAGVAV